MENPRDRRRFPRVPSEFSMHFSKIPVVRSDFRDAWVEDVSLGGVRFRCSGDVPVRSSQLFELLIPGEQPVHTFGRVAWIRERPDRDCFEVGGTFEAQSTSAHRTIQRHLQRELAPAGT